MSAHKNSHDDVPRLEPWLAVLGSSLVPVIGAVFLPSPLGVAAIIVSVALFAAGLLMLRRQTIRRRLTPTTYLQSEG